MNQRDLDARTRIPSYAWSGIESVLLGDEINVTCEQKHNEENSTHHLKNIRESMSVSGTSLQRYSQLRCGSCARLDDSQARRRRHSRRRIGEGFRRKRRQEYSEALRLARTSKPTGRKERRTEGR